MQVVFEVFDNLVLGLREKSQAPLVSHQARKCTYCERAGVPERVEQTGMSTQFPDTLPAPGQVVILLDRRLFHLLTCQMLPGGQRLSLIERLGTYFAGMIYPHQAQTSGLVGCREGIVHNRFCRIFPARANGFAKYCP